MTQKHKTACDESISKSCWPIICSQNHATWMQHKEANQNVAWIRPSELANRKSTRNKTVNWKIAK